MAAACGIPPETEIIYQHGKPNRPTIADTFAVNDGTSNTSQPALQDISSLDKPRRKKTTSLPDLPGDVAEPSSTPDTLWDTTDFSADSFGSDSLAEQ
jgi:hypothetical protein